MTEPSVASVLDGIASISRSSFPQAKTVLVTGGAGFIGSHVADMLLDRGDSVVIVDELNDYYDLRLKKANLDYLQAKYGPRFVFYKANICDKDFMTHIFTRESPTHVCHLAARAGVRASILDPYIYVHSNIEGTTRLLDLARQFGVANFVYASSSSVYGNSDKDLLTEDDAVAKPVSPYAATKKACELLAYTYSHLYGINTTGLRFFTVYGPRGRPDMAPFKFIERVYHNIPIQQYGDGSTSRDYTYISDIAEGVVAAIDTPLGYEVINLGNGRPYKLKDFISLVETCVGKKAVIQVLPEQPGDVERTCADISKARRLIGYSPRVTFEEGIRKTTEWYKTAAESGIFGEDAASDARKNSGAASPGTTSTSGSPSSKAKEDEPRPLARNVSDLELSSFVQKATLQLRDRKDRVFDAAP